MDSSGDGPVTAVDWRSIIRAVLDSAGDGARLTKGEWTLLVNGAVELAKAGDERSRAWLVFVLEGIDLDVDETLGRLLGS